jgi:hypothetical protein
MGTGALSLGVKRRGREADHSPPSSAEVKEFVELKIKINKTNFASCAVWVRNLVSHYEGGTQTEGFWERYVEEDICT